MAVRAAGPQQLPAVVGALAAGFAEDPVFRWMFGDEDFDRRLRGWLELVCGIVIGKGPCLIADQETGAILWTELGVPLAGPAEFDRVGEYLTETIGARAETVLGALSKAGAHKPDAPPSHHLACIAVRPEGRGAGLGAALIEPLLRGCDERAEHVYLHSTNPEVQPFYEHRGFEPLAVVATPDGGPTITPMWREPR